MELTVGGAPRGLTVVDGDVFTLNMDERKPSQSSQLHYDSQTGLEVYIWDGMPKAYGMAWAWTGS